MESSNVAGSSQTKGTAQACGCCAQSFTASFSVQKSGRSEVVRQSCKSSWSGLGQRKVTLRPANSSESKNTSGWAIAAKA